MKTPIRFLFTLLCAAVASVQSVHAATFSIPDGDVAALITAINTSNSNGEDDTIELATNGTYTLTIVDNGTNGLPVILTDGGHTLVIHGNGATLQRSTAGGTPNFRIFHVGNGADVTISGLTITNGNASGDFGGGIFEAGFSNPFLGSTTLTVNDSTLSGNSAGGGGGIYNNFGNLTVNNSTLSGNSATFGSAGGIDNDGEDSLGSTGTVTINNSTLSGNSGGIIFNDASIGGRATVTINNSTLSGNSGGGIDNAAEFGGRATLTVNNSTLSGNSGFGIFNHGESFGRATLTIGSTILNAGASGPNIFNFGTVTSLGYNLSSDSGGDCGGTTCLNGPGDQINTDPKLGPLRDNGGPTFTHGLFTGSPATDKGSNPLFLLFDQRGPGFPRTDGDETDVGAFEGVQPLVCPQGQGYWKNNPAAWPVTSLVLGGKTYTKTQLLKILMTPIGSGPKADASLILADQLIAAKLSIANGTDGTPVTSTIMNADSLLTGHPVGSHVKPSSSTGQAMINDANVLDNFNNGLLTLGCGL